MIGWIEKSALMRPLNFLRVSHQFAKRYNLFYPLILSGLTVVAVEYGSTPLDAMKRDGIIHSFSGIFSLMTPFYIAAIAAIATFSGKATIDKPFEMSSPVTLEILGDSGHWEVINVTPRHFLSLLFGYSTLVSLVLAVFSNLAPLLRDAYEKCDCTSAQYTLPFIIGIFFFFVFQLVLNTLLGVYFLSDKIHRYN